MKRGASKDGFSLALPDGTESVAEDIPASQQCLPIFRQKLVPADCLHSHQGVEHFHASLSLAVWSASTFQSSCRHCVISG